MQIKAINNYAKEGRLKVEILKDIGSGLNENRRNFKRLLEAVMNRRVFKVIVTYPDRLTRFGFKTLEEFFKSYGAEIVVINERERSSREELVEDLLYIISNFAGRLYGVRSHKYRKVVEGARKLISDP